MNIHRIKRLKSGWTRWQAPVMDGYLMQCCDCGLVHVVEFRTAIGRRGFSIRKPTGSACG
jgi:hypothetical protein